LELRAELDSAAKRLSELAANIEKLTQDLDGQKNALLTAETKVRESLSSLQQHDAELAARAERVGRIIAQVDSAKNEKLRIERELATLAEGRVFTGRMAKELGLVDRLGTLDDAVDEARQLAGLAVDEKLERILLPEPSGFFEDLFGQAGVTAAPVAKAAVLTFLAGLPGVDAFVEHLDALSLVTSGRPLMMLPARIHVR
jgi:ClpP class serine protease